MSLRDAVVVVQAVTFPVLAYLLVRSHDYRLAAAQFLLGVVTVLVYLS